MKNSKYAKMVRTENDRLIEALTELQNSVAHPEIDVQVDPQVDVEVREVNCDVECDPQIDVHVDDVSINIDDAIDSSLTMDGIARSLSDISSTLTSFLTLAQSILIDEEEGQASEAKNEIEGVIDPKSVNGAGDGESAVIDALDESRSLDTEHPHFNE